MIDWLLASAGTQGEIIYHGILKWGAVWVIVIGVVLPCSDCEMWFELKGFPQRFLEFGSVSYL